MANKTCSWLDITLKWLAILGIVIQLTKMSMRYINQHYHVLSLDLGNQLGI